jgi:hypothetical protein
MNPAANPKLCYLPLKAEKAAENRARWEAKQAEQLRQSEEVLREQERQADLKTQKRLQWEAKQKLQARCSLSREIYARGVPLKFHAFAPVEALPCV